MRDLAIAMSIGGCPLLAQGFRSPSPTGSRRPPRLAGKYVPGGEAPQYQGGKWIEITYGRPIKRGRDLWGAGARLRAHAERRRAGLARGRERLARGSRREVPLVINGKTVPAGEYSLFIDLKPNNWTLIVSRWAASPTFPGTKDALFGAFDYTPDKDVVRSADEAGRRSRSRWIS